MRARVFFVSSISVLLVVAVGMAFLGSEQETVAGSTPPSIREVSPTDTRVDPALEASIEGTCDGLDCSFLGSSENDGGVTEWMWEFGDGEGAVGAQVSHTFLGDGSYVVSLSVVNDSGDTDTASEVVTVAADERSPSGDSERVSGPLVSFTFECRQLTCEFHDTSADGGPLTDRSWVFGDGGVSQEMSPIHQYGRGGSYEVELIVTNEQGSTGTAKRIVTLELIPTSTTGTTTSTTAIVATPPPVSTEVPPLYPFGPHIGGAGGWELLDPKFTATHINPYPETVVEDLNAARAAGKSIVLMLARTGSNFSNPDGTFSLEMWKARIDAYAHIDFKPWIDDGTFVVHYLVSEPMARSRWGGEVITADVLDEMARYSKQYWPTLPTAVREQPTDLIENAGGYHVSVPGWTWKYLDASWARYSDRKGPIDQFITDEVAAARAQGLGLLLGMNVLSGGDGSSGRIGYSGGWVMSVNELLEYGTKLINEPYGCGVFMWRLDTDGIVYFARPEIDAAMEELAASARTRAPKSCVAR